MKYYTIGEILRMGLLKNHLGKPYTNRGTVSRVVNKMPYMVKNTPFGEAKTVCVRDINNHNRLICSTQK